MFLIKLFSLVPLRCQCFSCFSIFRGGGTFPCTSSTGPEKGTGVCRLHVSSPCLARAGEAQFANWLERLLLSSPPNVLQSLITLLFIANCQKIRESQCLKITLANCLITGDKWISLAEAACAAIARWEQAGPGPALPAQALPPPKSLDISPE